MMDRFLGALDDQYLPGSARGALFYQFGRKDPIPGTINLYNINGQLLPTNVWNRNPVLYNDAAGNNVFYSIYNPLAFITGTYNWSNINESSYLWLDSKNLITNKTASDLEAKTGNFAKSFFDPCPSGWKVPIKDITLDFRKDITIMNPSRNLYIQIGDTFGGLYWPYVKVGSGYPVGGRIYYPTTGYRTGATAVNNPGVHGKSWTATLSSLTHAYELSVLTQVSNSNIGYYEGTDLRTQANTIRCIRE